MTESTRKSLVVDTSAADAYLNQGGIILRAVTNYGLPNALRMTVGTEEQNRLAVCLLQQFMAA